MVSQGTPVSSISVIQPVTPPCQTKTVQYQGAPISYTPPHVGSGDSEFNGHGPVVTARMSVFRSGSNVNWLLYMDARETVSDWTEVEGQTNGVFYTPEPGWAVDSVSPGYSEFTYTDTNHDPDIKYPGSGPVDHFTFIGDTDGDDVGRTGVTVYFRPINVTLIQNTGCVSPTLIRLMTERKQLSTEAVDRFKIALPPSGTQ